MSDEESSDENQGPAKNIPQLTLACMNLASEIDEADICEEKTSLIIQHLDIYSKDNIIPMVPFEKGLEWFNVSREIDLKDDLCGKIVVIDFFTYCCINCMHILPDLEALEELFPPEKGVIVIGAHSAKFDNERLSNNIIAALEKYNIHHPVVNDAHAKMWTQLGIACWPTLLILGPNSEPLFILVGEGHREKLLKYIEISLDYFTKQGKMNTTSTLPLSPALRIPSLDSGLLYPGKVTSCPLGVIISDSGHNRIIITNFAGTVKMIIGSGESGFTDGNFTAAKFNNPQGAAYLAPDTIFIADTDNHAVRQINLKERTVTTLCGTGKQSRDLEGGKTGNEQGISSPWDLCLAMSPDQCNKDQRYNLLIIAMAGNHQLWGVFLSDASWIKNSSFTKGTVVRLAGSGAEENRNTTYPLKAGFAQPSGVTLFLNKSTETNLITEQFVYIADAESSSVRRFSVLDGAVKAVVGGARDPLDLFAYGDKDGTSIDGKLQHPLGVCELNGDIFVTDSYNHKVKVIKRQGKLYSISTISGTGKAGDQCGKLLTSQFNEPGGLCADKEHNLLFVADTNNHCIKQLNLGTSEATKFILTFPTTNDDVVIDTTDCISNSMHVKVPSKIKSSLSLDFKFDLNIDLTLNLEAPNKWRILSEDSSLIFDRLEGPLNKGEHVRVQVMPHNELRIFSILLTMFICTSDGTCVQRQIKQQILLEVDYNLDDFNEELMELTDCILIN